MGSEEVQTNSAPNTSIRKSLLQSKRYKATTLQRRTTESEFSQCYYYYPSPSQPKGNREQYNKYINVYPTLGELYDLVMQINLYCLVSSFNPFKLCLSCLIYKKTFARYGISTLQTVKQLTTIKLHLPESTQQGLSFLSVFPYYLLFLYLLVCYSLNEITFPTN